MLKRVKNGEEPEHHARNNGGRKKGGRKRGRVYMPT
jgi:hypothetical protein